MTLTSQTEKSHVAAKSTETVVLGLMTTLTLKAADVSTHAMDLNKVGYGVLIMTIRNKL